MKVELKIRKTGPRTAYRTISIRPENAEEGRLLAAALKRAWGVRPEGAASSAPPQQGGENA